jgi:hypothetical protein
MIGLLLAAFVTSWSAKSADAQLYYRTPNGAVVAMAPIAPVVTHYPYTYNANYFVPTNNYGYGYGYNYYGVSRPVFPILPPRVTITRTQLDPQRHFFTGNGSSYSHGTSQIWSNSRRVGF